MSTKTSLELREEARTGTSMALVLYSLVPCTWKRRVEGVGSLLPAREVPPWGTGTGGHHWCHRLNRLPSPHPQQPCAHRIHHHLALENGHQVGWLLAHGDADLHGLVVVLLVQDNGLVGGGGQLICAGLAALGRAEQGSAPTTAPFSLLGRGNPHAVPMGSCIGADHPQCGEMPLSPTYGQ